MGWLEKEGGWLERASYLLEEGGLAMERAGRWLEKVGLSWRVRDLVRDGKHLVGKGRVWLKVEESG